MRGSGGSGDPSLPPSPLAVAAPRRPSLPLTASRWRTVLSEDGVGGGSEDALRETEALAWLEAGTGSHLLDPLNLLLFAGLRAEARWDVGASVKGQQDGLRSAWQKG